jgi:hypothetical protein
MQFSVTDTNIEALKAKKSAVILGYMKDEFINFIVPDYIRKEVVLNKGYWSRYFCIYNLVHKFLLGCSDSEEAQILSVGCGLDTMPFNLFKTFKEQYNRTNFSYFECDLKSVAQQKAKIISSHSKLEETIASGTESVNIGQDFVKTNRYALFDADLNDVGHLQKQLERFGFDPELIH